MNLIKCPTNTEPERKTPPQSPSEDLAAVSDPMRNAELLAKMASLGGGRGKGKKGNGTTAGDILIPWLIERGAYYDGKFFVWPGGRRSRAYLNKIGYHKMSKNFGNGICATFSLARFVCWQAHGAPQGDRNVADHINRIRNDDRPENLHWVTQKENIHNVEPVAWINRAKNIVRLNALSPDEKRVSMATTKLTKQEVLEMRLIYATGRFTAREIGRKYDCGHTNSLRIMRGHNWKDVPVIPPVVEKPVIGEWPTELLRLWETTPGPQSWGQIFQAMNL